MAFKTFAPGVLTSSDVNTFLMRQAVITCTASTRPASPSEGMTIYETDTDQYLSYTGAAWRTMGQRIGAALVSFTPTYNNFTIGNGTSTGFYQQVGRFVYAQGEITFGSTTAIGTDANKSLEVNYPVALQNVSGTSELAQLGASEIRDTSAALSIFGLARTIADGISVSAYYTAAPGNSLQMMEINSTDWSLFTFAAGDFVRWNALYAGVLNP